MTRRKEQFRMLNLQQLLKEPRERRQRKHFIRPRFGPLPIARSAMPALKTARDAASAAAAERVAREAAEKVAEESNARAAAD